ncbi:MAG: NUDIX domain-containing protein [Ignavibacteria bacterium]|nr:NUDIX domain-containing protein [Ignavibacteria bacterium]
MIKIKANFVEVHIIRQVKKDIEFLLLKRANNELYPNIWQMVSGSIKNNENTIKTVLRELKEETKLTPQKLFVAPIVNSFYLAEKDELNLVPVFVCKVNYKDKVQISKEHSDYKWVKLKSAKKLLAWEGQRRAVQIIYDYWIKENESLKFVEIKINKNKR